MTSKEASTLKKDQLLVDTDGQTYRYIGQTDHVRPKIICTDGRFTFRLSRTSLSIVHQPTT